MLVFAYEQGGTTATGLVSLGLLIPTALFAPFAGPLIDRFGASRVLLGAYGVQAAAMTCTAAALLAGAPAAACYVLGAVTAMALAVTHPAHAVVSPGIARTTEQLVALNAVTGWILSVGLAAAPALAGLILGISSPGAVYASGAVCLAAAALLVVPLRALVPPLAREEDASASGALRELEEGARVLARSGPSREVVIVLTATFLMVGAFDVLAVALAVGTLGMGGSGAGYLTAMHGAGAVAGAVLSFALVGRSRLVPVIVGAALLAAFSFLLLGLSTTVAVAFGVAAVSGISRSLLEVTGQTLLQRVTSTAMLARAFAFKEGLAMGAWGVGSAVVPIAAALWGIEGALIATGAIVPIAVLVRLRPLLRVDSSAVVPVVRVALLRSLDIFRGLPVPALEGIAHTARDVTVPAGTVVVCRGDRGESYFVVADGTVDVVRDGRIVRTLGRGEGFGEIALLHDVARTATVTAATPATLVEVDRDAFLVAVTGHAQTRQRAAHAASERLLADLA